ncbi:MAG: hypothetical protein K2X91_00460 [Thermoleophilia bacterium]|nr:hypothetical protein [Thermoleophilia bacterium]
MGFATRAEIMQRIAQGKAVLFPAISTAGASVNTTQNAGDAWHVGQFNSNSIGSTLPATIVGFPLPPSPSADIVPLFFTCGASAGTGGGHWLGRIYKLGTVALTGTAPLDVFTHDAATFPVTRTHFGEATKPVSLIPIIRVTTAPATSAPVLQLVNTGGTTGYTDQDGNATLGTRTFTFPSATTAARSMFILPLEAGDAGVRDITSIKATTTGTGSGAADVWGLEPICPLTLPNSVIGGAQDMLFSGLRPQDLAPAVATSGTATSHLIIFRFGGGTDVNCGWFAGVLNS